MIWCKLLEVQGCDKYLDQKLAVEIQWTACYTEVIIFS